MGSLATLPTLGDVDGPQFVDYGDTGFGPIGGTPTLPSFESTAPALPTVTQAPAASSGGINWESPILNSAQSALKSASTMLSGGTVLQWIENNLENLVFIILGLMLITAGVFSFKQTQTVIREGGGAAATAAAAAA
jgi:hypothetical protein